MPGRPDPRILVVIPAWNEAGAVAGTIAEVRASQPASTSSWSTTDRATAPPRSRAAAGAVVARLPFNLGVGGAMRTGYRYAMREDYDVVVQIDADGQHDPTLPSAAPRRARGLRRRHRRPVRR